MTTFAPIVRLEKAETLSIVFDGRTAERIRSDALKYRTTISEVVRVAVEQFYAAGGPEKAGSGRGKARKES